MNTGAQAVTAADETILVKWRRDTSPAEMNRYERTLGLTPVPDALDVLGRIGWRRLRLLKGSSRMTVTTTTLAASPLVERVEADMPLQRPAGETASPSSTRASTNGIPTSRTLPAGAASSPVATF